MEAASGESILMEMTVSPAERIWFEIVVRGVMVVLAEVEYQVAQMVVVECAFRSCLIAVTDPFVVFSSVFGTLEAVLAVSKETIDSLAHMRSSVASPRE